MILLALETATDRPSIALGAANGAREEFEFAGRNDLSALIDGAVRDLLVRVGAKAGDLGGLVVADGPGSFTGLRIGFAFAKGFCRATGVPLLVAPSMLGAALTALRGSAPGSGAGGGAALVEYDALRGDVYRAAWRIGGRRVELLMEPALASRDAPLDAALPPGLVRASEAQARAGSLLDLAHFEHGATPIAESDGFAPSYGRLAEAEARRLANDAGG